MEPAPVIAFAFVGTGLSGVYAAASEAMAGRPFLEGTLRLDLSFRRPRPASHYGPGGVLLPERAEDAPAGPGPARFAAEVEWALLGIAIGRASQIVTVRATRHWGEAGGLVELHRA